MEVPGQGLTMSCQFDLNHSCCNARSLPHCATAGTPNQWTPHMSWVRFKKKKKKKKKPQKPKNPQYFKNESDLLSLGPYVNLGLCRPEPLLVMCK